MPEGQSCSPSLRPAHVFANSIDSADVHLARDSGPPTGEGRSRPGEGSRDHSSGKSPKKAVLRQLL